MGLRAALGRVARAVLLLLFILDLPIIALILLLAEAIEQRQGYAWLDEEL